MCAFMGNLRVNSVLRVRKAPAVPSVAASGISNVGVRNNDEGVLQVGYHPSQHFQLHCHRCANACQHQGWFGTNHTVTIVTQSL